MMATPPTVAATVTLVVEIKGEKSSLQYLEMEAPCRELLRRCRDRADIYHMAQ
jgi:hypothetical protein